MDTADLPIGQPDFDASGMVRGLGQEILDHAFGQESRTLVLF